MEWLCLPQICLSVDGPFAPEAFKLLQMQMNSVCTHPSCWIDVQVEAPISSEGVYHTRLHCITVWVDRWSTHRWWRCCYIRLCSSMRLNRQLRNPKIAKNWTNLLLQALQQYMYKWTIHAKEGLRDLQMRVNILLSLKRHKKQTCFVCNLYSLGTPYYLFFTANCIPRISFLVYGLFLNLFMSLNLHWQPGNF